MRPRWVSLWANYLTCSLAVGLCQNFHLQGSDKAMQFFSTLISSATYRVSLKKVSWAFLTLRTLGITSCKDQVSRCAQHGVSVLQMVAIPSNSCLCNELLGRLLRHTLGAEHLTAQDLLGFMENSSLGFDFLSFSAAVSAGRKSTNASCGQSLHFFLYLSNQSSYLFPAFFPFSSVTQSGNLRIYLWIPSNPLSECFLLSRPESLTAVWLEPLCPIPIPCTFLFITWSHFGLSASQASS